MQTLKQKINGSTPIITLLISIVATIGMGAGWIYTIKANAADISAIKQEYMRKDVAEKCFENLQSTVNDISEDIKDIERHLREKK